MAENFGNHVHFFEVAIQVTTLLLEGYSCYFFCVVCLSQTDFEDGFMLSLQTGINA